MSGPSAAALTIDQARQYFLERVVADVQPLLDAGMAAAQRLSEQTAVRAVAQQRADMRLSLQEHGAGWLQRLVHDLRERLAPQGPPSTASGQLLASMKGEPGLHLVDDETIQRNIQVSRLTLAILDRSTWEFADLRARLGELSRRQDLDDDDLFRPQALALCLLMSWIKAGLTLETWRGLEESLHQACAGWIEKAYHETNAWLVARGVLPQIDLNSFIVRKGSGASAGPAAAAEAPPRQAGAGGQSAAAPLGPNITRVVPFSLGPSASDAGADARRTGQPRHGVHYHTDGSDAGLGPGQPHSTGEGPDLDQETRQMTRQGGGALLRAEVVLERFSDILERHLPGFRDTAQQGRQPSARLSDAMARAQQRVVAQVLAPAGEAPAPEQLARELSERHQALKQAANTPEERATVELVALLFQAILTDERIPAAMRVWFARLQMPTLRVALAEPDFFSGVDHPARRLIDRMGACVMGFEGGAEIIGSPLEAEIRRIVQVVEAFPDTGKRVFQAVLTEFEKFLERFYRETHAGSRAGVSLAQQIEQRETLAIQYTIELRKMLNEVPIQEGVRDFLFHIWADVLATMAVRHGAQSTEVTLVRDAATDLIWTASAKTTREERAEVIRRLPPLLGALRLGMTTAGLDAGRQDAAIKAVNLALTAAFSSRAMTINPEQLEQLKQRLATIEELIPDDDVEIDDSWVLDEASHRHEGLEIVAEGGSMPGPSMLAAAGGLQLGDAYMLEYRGRREPVRLAWQGMHKQLSLFVSASARCVLFQKTRLAAFLQAGLLVPVQDESLTLAATRDALRKLSAEPARLSA